MCNLIIVIEEKLDARQYKIVRYNINITNGEPEHFINPEKVKNNAIKHE